MPGPYTQMLVANAATTDAAWQPVTTGGVQITANTTAMTGGAGTCAYISAAATASPTDSATLAKATAVGVYDGTSGKLVGIGEVDGAQFTTAGGAPTFGVWVFIAAATDDANTGAGKFTATAPTAGVLTRAGICLDASNYAGAKTAKVFFLPQVPISL